MTSVDSTTPAVALQPVALPVAPVDLGELMAAAQHAGDLAYAYWQELEAEPPQCADAYHQSFARYLWLRGALLPCACDFCEWLRSDEGLKGGE